MPYTEIVKEHIFETQLNKLREQFSRIDEFDECADWQIGKNYEVFKIAFSTRGKEIRVWRSDVSEVLTIPTVEIAYYYNLDDGLIHFLGIRVVPPELEQS